MRCALLLVVAAGAWSAESYAFANATRAYIYETTQEVAWASVGDQLKYTTSLSWRLILKGRSAREAAVTILRVQAHHEGPGSSRSVDSGGDPGADPDPLLGHLTALEGVTLVLTVDPTTGQVASVTGTEVIAKRVAALVPNLVDPSAPSPIDAQARSLYSSEHLAALWTGILALPTGPTRLPLAGPQGGTLVRTWDAKGNAWTASLAEPELPVTLGKAPTEVTGTLSGLTGSGTLALAGGLPQEATGDVRFTLKLTALTQPVESHHHLTWRLAPAK